MPPPVRSYVLRREDEATHPDSIRAALAEFFSTFIFVFAAEGSIFALDKMYTDTGTTVTSLIMIALASALSLSAAVASSIHVSGGHLNPAITFGALVGGRISLIRAIYYWIAQLLGAIRPLGLILASGEGELRELLLEAVMTFGLVYTFYATAIDPKRGSLGIIGPLAIGFILGANILVGGPFDGASMNPARAFGPALVEWRWRHHWIYWLGPFIGAALAGLIYEFMVIPTEAPHHPLHQPLAPEDY
ncbi:hypothetical protein EUGRSUZ_L03165 [Eucalyptus grandis]|uniref:Aquaporin TIP3-1 n=1 Tax=Eucalyptus grandis TaxID=71139 RepID=A0AAD9WII0_EUCGR|nr:hypothetical protein EUGRSUZ_L03165 [Eucalyptus grandis]